MDTTFALTSITGVISRLRDRCDSGVRALINPDHWALLSCCDWYPDALGFPTHLAALADDNVSPPETS